MTKLEEYSKKYGLDEVTNDMGEIRRTSERSIVFPNGRVASIVDGPGEISITHPDGTIEERIVSTKKYSVAVCDYNGYFNFEILNQYDGIEGCIYCDTEDEVIAACEIIRNM